MVADLILVILLLLRSNLAALGSAMCSQYPANNTNTAYSTNLDAAMSPMSTHIDSYGFYSASKGTAPDTANAVALCRGDMNHDDCRSCVGNTSAELLSSCPIGLSSTAWSDDIEFCMVRYSSEPIFGKLATGTGTGILKSPGSENVRSPDVYSKYLRTLLDSLRAKAVNGSSLKIAVGNSTTPDFQNIYALVQCSPDLSPDDCSDCLVQLPACCDGFKSGKVASPSCFIFYDTDNRFYNETRLLELEPPAPLLVLPDHLQPPVPSPGNKSSTRVVIVIVVSVVVLLLVILAAFSVVLLRKRMKQKRTAEKLIEIKEEAADDIITAESIQYAFSIISAATDDFSDNNKLGQGGFGAVYKGKLPNNQEIAVKRLSENSGQGDQEFKNEVVLLAKLQHRNLVKLLGFSLQGTEKLIIYEFVPNTSLDRFIFDPTNRACLDWETRYNIIGGIAKGLLYLHEDSQVKIIHRDLKASNVLLGAEMNPKIADFGIARLFGEEETQASTSKIVGTFGYMSPEYAMHGQFSVRSDVFSFGVLVLEILSGQKNNCMVNGKNVELLTCTWKHWREGTAENIIDPVLIRADGTGSLRDMLRCIHVGLLCVEEDAANRPTMASILLMLSSSTVTLPLPVKPAFVTVNRLRVVVPDDDIFTTSTTNNVTVTDLYPVGNLQ